MGLHIDTGSTSRWANTADYRAHLTSALQDIHQAARDALSDAYERHRISYDERHEPLAFTPGEQVWLFSPAVRKGLSKKLNRPWQGPFRILRKVGPVTYKLAGLGNRRIHQVVNVARLKRYVPRVAAPTTAPPIPPTDQFDPEQDMAPLAAADATSDQQQRTMIDEELRVASIVQPLETSTEEDELVAFRGQGGMP